MDFKKIRANVEVCLEILGLESAEKRETIIQKVFNNPTIAGIVEQNCGKNISSQAMDEYDKQVIPFLEREINS